MTESALKKYSQAPTRRPKLVRAQRCGCGFLPPLCPTCHAPSEAEASKLGKPSVLGQKTGSFTCVSRVPSDESGELDCRLRCECGSERVITRRHLRHLVTDGSKLRCYVCKPHHVRAKRVRHKRLDGTESLTPDTQPSKETDTQ